jgi:hypothetical protein
LGTKERREDESIHRGMDAICLTKWDGDLGWSTWTQKNIPTLQSHVIVDYQIDKTKEEYRIRQQQRRLPHGIPVRRNGNVKADRDNPVGNVSSTFTEMVIKISTNVRTIKEGRMGKGSIGQSYNAVAKCNRKRLIHKHDDNQ